MRIGHGYDVHRLVAGRKLIMGGVEIPWNLGLLGHSEADVLLHAIADAILGAIGEGDIGKHFPDTDQAFRGIDSRILLRNVLDKLKELGYSVINVDLTIVAQAPKMAPHIPTMRQHIAADLEIQLDAVNVKATTTEGMGFEGRREGISAMAVALLQRA